MQLRRLFRVINGGTPTPDPENWDGGIPWATPIDIGNAIGRITVTRRSLTNVGVSAGSRLVPTGSILVSTRAPIGYIAEVGVPMAFNQGCRALVPSRPVDSRYFRYQLLALTDELQSKGQGTTFYELSSDGLAGLYLAVPPLGEQRRIADFLDAETARLDDLVGLRSRQVVLLEEAVQSELSSVADGLLAGYGSIVSIR